MTSTRRSEVDALATPTVRATAEVQAAAIAQAMLPTGSKTSTVVVRGAETGVDAVDGGRISTLVPLSCLES